MSAYAPNFQQSGPTQRHFGDHDLYQSTQSNGYHASPAQERSGTPIGDKVSGFFGADRRNQLPMYKDKPTNRRGGYRYPGDMKKPWFRRRRIVVGVLGALAFVNWWFGILSPMSWFIGGGDSSITKAYKASTWDARAEQVREVFRISWKGYEDNAWGMDEYHPVSKNGRQMTPSGQGSGMGWIIVDALDTMMIMNLTTELSHARQWLHHNLTYDQDHDVNTFETTIRMLGGLLSAHYLSTSKFPNLGDASYAAVSDDLSDDLYIEKATDLADRLLGAYETASGIPLASINLHTMKGIPSHTDGGASSTSEATSLQLEMKYLAKLTGEDHYWHKAEKIMQVIDAANPTDGLVPIYINAETGTFRGENVRLGSRGDSYYEYLIKQYLQTSSQEDVYKSMWDEAVAGMKKWLITYSYPSNFTVIAERPTGLEKKLSAKMDHLVCFMPGTLALAITGGKTLAEARAASALGARPGTKSTDGSGGWNEESEEDMRLAEELMNTCWGMYMDTPCGLAGEITHFNIHNPPLMYNAFINSNAGERPHSPANFDTSISPGHDFAGRDDFMIKGPDSHNLQRPETVESLFYLWRITGKEKYREWGWEMFQSFLKHTIVGDGTGFSSLQTVLKTPPPLRDNMESFWLAETLKYFYLLFSPNDILPLDQIVFNTEAHPFPRFQMGKLFQTGWERKPRDAKGNILEAARAVGGEARTIVRTEPTPLPGAGLPAGGSGNMMVEPPKAEPGAARQAAGQEGFTERVLKPMVMDPVSGKGKPVGVGGNQQGDAQLAS